MSDTENNTSNSGSESNTEPSQNPAINVQSPPMPEVEYKSFQIDTEQKSG